MIPINQISQYLLSVDLGVKTGFAMFRSDGRLLWFRSQNFGNKVRLRKAIPWILSLEEEIDYIVIEGGGPLRKIWDTRLEKRNISVMHIMAEDWRHDIMLEREQRKGVMAKEKALEYAGKFLRNQSVGKTGGLNIDAAEAILIGVWGMKKLGWINSTHEMFR